MQDDGVTEKQIIPKLKVYEEYVIWKNELKELSKALFGNACAYIKVTDKAKKYLLSVKSIRDIKFECLVPL